MVYIDPTSKLEFYEYISSVMQNLINKSIMFVGDFNIDILDEVNASEFSNIMYSHYFIPVMIWELTLDEWKKTGLLNSWLDASFFGDVWWSRA